jgi:hypothetical protein
MQSAQERADELCRRLNKPLAREDQAETLGERKKSAKRTTNFRESQAVQTGKRAGRRR